MIPDNALKIALPPGRRWQALVRRADFLRLTASGMRRVTPGFILQAAPRGDHPTPQLRIGFTASRKVGNAVKRNRARRRLKAVAGEILPAHGMPGFDLVLIARPATVDRPYRDLVQDFTAALKRMRVYAETGGGR